MLDDDTKDRYRPRRFDEDPPPVSLLNEVPEYRDREGVTVLHRWPKGRPLHAALPLRRNIKLPDQIPLIVSHPDPSLQLPQ
jgi:hypothetical protein